MTMDFLIIKKRKKICFHFLYGPILTVFLLSDTRGIQYVMTSHRGHRIQNSSHTRIYGMKDQGLTFRIVQLYSIVLTYLATELI